MSDDSEYKLRSHHDSKFVHNVRIWGADGQQALEKTHLILCGINATATETAKNLILPGVMQFTIVDDKQVTEDDEDANYFCHPSDQAVAENSSLAVRCHSSLCELHLPSRHTSGVRGDTIIKNPNDAIRDGSMVELIAKDAKTMNIVVVVAASRVTSGSLAALAQQLAATPQAEGVLLCVLYVSGLVAAGRFAIVSPQAHRIPFPVVFSLPQSAMKPYDLRPLEPFPALQKWFDEHTTEAVLATHVQGSENNIPISHIPWPALFNEFLKAEGYYEKTDEREKEKARRAAKNRVLLTCPEVSEKTYMFNHMKNRSTPYLDKIIEYSEGVVSALREGRPVEPKGARLDNFTLVAYALGVFRKNNNKRLPLYCDLPDIHCESCYYNDLRHIYATERERETEEVRATCLKLLQELQGVNVSPGVVVASESSIAQDKGVGDIVHRAHDLRLIFFLPLQAEYQATEMGSKVKITNTEPTKFSDALYPCLVAQHHDASVNSSNNEIIPLGYAEDADLEAAQNVLCEGAQSFYTGLGEAQITAAAKEVVRGGGRENVLVASAMGALAAEQLIKVIQRRYVPAQEVVIYNGIRGEAAFPSLDI